ncbi:MAG: DUF2849 domain-containing protein [Paracoccaceae bacterium]
MARPFSPKVITANALINGAVIYLTPNDNWSPDHAQAELITDEDHAQLRLLDAQMQPDIVGAYLADATSGGHGPQPIHFRDITRAKGPSNYHHGKQEASNNVSV